MNFWKRPEKKPFSIRVMSREQIEEIGKRDDFGCGAGKLMMLLLPEFTFKYSCVRHDLGCRRGGALKDKLESDWMLFRFISIDTLRVAVHIAQNKWWGCIVAIPMSMILYIIGLIYVVFVLAFNWITFSWGKYKDLGTILDTN